MRCILCAPYNDGARGWGLFVSRGVITLIVAVAVAFMLGVIDYVMQ